MSSLASPFRKPVASTAPTPSSAALPSRVLQRKNDNLGRDRGSPLLRRTSDATLEVPSVVHEVLRSPGQPLDAATRAFMEPRFHRDFSQVRVHVDSRAADSARSVSAMAYTVGQNIVFGGGSPGMLTSEGRSLMAHELAHTVQQGFHGAVVGKLSLESSNSASEMEAANVADAVEKNEPTPKVSKMTGGPVVQRSILGGAAGGGVGAAGGAALGFLLGGPIAAVLGGIAGLVGGALVGDRLTGRRRSLSASDIAYAKQIFRDTIDYTKITITRDSLLSLGAPKTIGNTIHLKSDWGGDQFKGDTMELTELGLQTLIHEMGHVWQYQNGGLAYIPESLWAQFKGAFAGKGRGDAYNWQSVHAAGLPWEKWNPEQQAEAIEAYNVTLREYNQLQLKISGAPATSGERSRLSALQVKLSILEPYMRKVWRKEGAPHFFGAASPMKTARQA